MPLRQSERLHLRAVGAGPFPEDATEVVYADAWDELCDVATELAGVVAALRQHARDADAEFDGSDIDDRARQALRSYFE